MSSAASPHTPPESFDRIARDLQALRDDSGQVSFAELVRRITELRLAKGVHAAAAIPARSTVYNAFKTGRARMDTELLSDIVLALGADPEQAEVWVKRCGDARRAAERTAKPHLPLSRPIAAEAPARAAVQWSPALIAGALVVCTAVNLFGLSLVAVFKLSVYLDMVGTAIAAIVFGPWHAVAVAIATNSLGFVTGDSTTLTFAPVNVVGALVWGFGVRRFRMGTDLSRFVSLNLVTALACSLVAAPLVAVVFYGGAGHASEQAVLSLQAAHLPFLVSVFSANIISSIMDKLLTSFIALAVFTLLHSRFGISAAHMPLVEKLASLRSTGASEVTGPR